VSERRGLEAGFRREPRKPLDVGSEPTLVDRLRAEIAASGPLTFARFMELALYEPGLGYYRRARSGPGAAGADFLTAPETHPIFGRAVARQVHEVWERLGRPAELVVREHGAGTGALAVGILDGLAVERSPLIDAVVIEPVEIEAARLAAFDERLRRAGHARRHRPASREPITGVVLANEVLDALPVHRVEWRDGRLREGLVDWLDGRFIEVLAPPTTPALEERLRIEGIELREGQRAEICLALDGWMAAASAGLGRGLLLLIDYGHPASQLYGPRRAAGTLAAYVNHRVHADPFVNVGRQDVTAHVDVTAVERAGSAAGLAPVGITSQAEFLAGLGIEALLREAQSDPRTTMEAYLALRSGLMRVLDPAATGGFQVMGFARDFRVEPPLRGFAYRLARTPPHGR